MILIFNGGSIDLILIWASNWKCVIMHYNSNTCYKVTG